MNLQEAIKHLEKSNNELLKNREQLDTVIKTISGEIVKNITAINEKSPYNFPDNGPSDSFYIDNVEYCVSIFDDGKKVAFVGTNGWVEPMTDATDMMKISFVRNADKVANKFAKLAENNKQLIDAVL